MSDDSVSQLILCSDGVYRTKQELFDMLPLLRFEDWELHNRDGNFVWERRIEPSP